MSQCRSLASPVGTVFGALRLGFEVYLIADTCADLTREIHDISVTRMLQAEVMPINWYGLAGDFHYNHASPIASVYQTLQRRFQPTMAMGAATFFAGQAQARVAQGVPQRDGGPKLTRRRWKAKRLAACGAVSFAAAVSGASPYGGPSPLSTPGRRLTPAAGGGSSISPPRSSAAVSRSA